MKRRHFAILPVDKPHTGPLWSNNRCGPLRVALVPSQPAGLGATSETSETSDNWYSTYGLLTAVSNHFGQLRGVVYDPLDQSTNVVDADGIVVSQTFDNLGRLTTRVYAGGGTNVFKYSTNGLVAYTNALQKVTWYTNDAAGRRIYERDANTNTTWFGYTAAGDLRKMTNTQAPHATTWHYDLYGRVVRKLDDLNQTNFVYEYDTNGRLTNRWSAAKGNTAYTYDRAGNLTNRNQNGFVQRFTVNTLDQLTGAGRSGRLTVAGTSSSAATDVTVNSSLDCLWPYAH